MSPSTSLASYDVVVVGAGHAGCEAAAAAARLGARTLLVTLDLSSVALMPCNPSVGGPGKGHLVRELYCLGGLMPRVLDESALQFRVLNETKGPAVRALRAQADKRAYGRVMRRSLEAIPGLDLYEGEVAELLLHSSRKEVAGVVLAGGATIQAARVVVCTGVYLDSRIVIGRQSRPGGPQNLANSLHLADALAATGLEVRRLQTATPPRVHARSIRLEGLQQRPAQDVATFTGAPPPRDPRPVYVTRTNPETVRRIKDHLAESPLKLGNITDHGPRHCPSIDRKVIRFPDKGEHTIFLEPEGRDTHEVYLQGFTTSMPAWAQEAIIRSIRGLEEAEILRYGYAIEYAYVPPWQLRRTMASRVVGGLYLAGQINGTTGYEEAAGQGWLAGVNAARSLRDQAPYLPRRDQAYMGVLVDDLVTRDHREPYRMTTSRAEFRLVIRNDNATERLMADGYALGLVPRGTLAAEHARALAAQIETCRLRTVPVRPTRAVQQALVALGSDPPAKKESLAEVLARPRVHHRDLSTVHPAARPLPGPVAEKVEVACKYDAYVGTLAPRLREYRRLEGVPIPEGFDYDLVPGLEEEEREILVRFRPASLASLGRLKGLGPEVAARVGGALATTTGESASAAVPLEGRR